VQPKKLAYITMLEEKTMKLFRWWLVVVAIAIAGCAQPVKRQAYNTEANAGVRQVVLAQLADQSSYEAVIVGHPGESFGLIGGLMAAADTQAKSNKLTAAVDAAQTKLRDQFTKLLLGGLTAQGFTVEVVVVPEETAPESAVAKVKAESKADAIMVSRVTGSYWAAGPMTDYQPRILADIVVIHLATGATLYQDTFTYGYTDPNQKDTVHFPADPKYKFKDIDALVANPGLAREGWVEGLKLISAQVVNDVRRR
jgi:hypothetical protein